MSQILKFSHFLKLLSNMAKVQVKSPYLTKHHAIKTTGRSGGGGVAPCIFKPRH